MSRKDWTSDPRFDPTEFIYSPPDGETFRGWPRTMQRNLVSAQIHEVSTLATETKQLQTIAANDVMTRQAEILRERGERLQKAIEQTIDCATDLGTLGDTDGGGINPAPTNHSGPSMRKSKAGAKKAALMMKDRASKVTLQLIQIMKELAKIPAAPSEKVSIATANVMTGDVINEANPSKDFESFSNGKG